MTTSLILKSMIEEYYNTIKRAYTQVRDEKTPDKISGKTNKKRQEASYKNAYDIDVRSEKTFRALESTGCVREMIVIIHLILQYVM